MFSLGVLIGLVVLKERMPKRGREIARLPRLLYRDRRSQNHTTGNRVWNISSGVAHRLCGRLSQCHPWFRPA